MGGFEQRKTRLVFHLSAIKCMSAIVGNDCNKYMIVNSFMQSGLPTLRRKPRTYVNRRKLRDSSTRKITTCISWDARGSGIGSC